MVQEITFDPGNHTPVNPNMANELPLITPLLVEQEKTVSSRLHKKKFPPAEERYTPEGKGSPVGDTVGVLEGEATMTLQRWNQRLGFWVRLIHLNREARRHIMSILIWLVDSGN